MNIKTQYKNIINYFVGPVLFLILSYSIYRRVSAHQSLSMNWTEIKQLFSIHIKSLVLLLVLMFCNWGIEARKWQILIRPIQRVPYGVALRAIFSGQAISMLIPNGMGDYIGKLLYLKSGNRLRSIATSLVGGVSQLLVTLLLGIVGIYYIYHYVPGVANQLNGLSIFWLSGVLYAMIVAIITFTIMYFKISWFVKLLKRIPFVYKNRIFIIALQSYNFKILFEILLWSFLRYAVFIIQYYLIMRLLQFNFSIITIFWMVAVMFLIFAMVPTIPIADLGVRGEIMLRLFGLVTTNMTGLIVVTTVIWIVNLLLPSVIGTVCLLGVKLFKKK